MTVEGPKRRIAVLGAGVGGICAGIKLLEAGYDDLTILEAAPGVGGTWFHNRYPGAECDVMSHLYSYSFEPNAEWSQRYARQPEILAYLERCVAKYALSQHIRFDAKVESARWNDRDCAWEVGLADGSLHTADVVVSALGMFNEPVMPDIEGLASFAGVTIHSARWPLNPALEHKRVGVVGTAASAIQLIPEVAANAGQLTVFQRTATWVLPKDDRPYDEEHRAHFREDPGAIHRLRAKLIADANEKMTFSDPEALRAAEAAGLANLEVVEDLDLRDRLTPRVPWGSRRPIMSNAYYPTFNRPNVELITDPISHVQPNGVVTADEQFHELDVLILATGFRTTEYLSALDVYGRGGRELRKVWGGEPRSYLGVLTAGFPNLFMLYGPNTNNGSIIFMIECQVEYLLRRLRWMDEQGLAWIDVRREAMDAYNAELQQALDQVEVWQGDHGGYYRGASGRIVTQWPHTMDDYQALLQGDPDDSLETRSR